MQKPKPKAVLTKSFQKLDKNGKPVGKPVVTSSKDMKMKSISDKQFFQKKYGGSTKKK